MSNRYVYCVVHVGDGYLEVFNDFEDAKEDFIDNLGLYSKEDAKRDIATGFCDNVKFFDKNHNPILTPTNDMLFYYNRIIHNWEFNIFIAEYILFDQSELDNFENYYRLDECELIKREIH